MADREKRRFWNERFIKVINIFKHYFLIQFIQMKKSLLMVLLIISSIQLYAQEKHPSVVYMEQFSKEYDYLQQLHVDYLSNLVHGKERDALEKEEESKDAVDKAVKRVEEIKAFDNDKGLKDAALNAFKVMKDMENLDLDALVEKKAGCTECFEAVEVRYELSEKESDKVNKALEKWNEKTEAFAKEHDITLVENDNAFNKIIGKVNRLNNYLQDIELCVAEANYANNAVFEAFSAQDIKAAKKEVTRFKKAVKNAQKRLETVKAIPEDNQTIVKARILLSYFDKMGKDMYPDMLKAFDKKGRVTQKGAKVFNKNIDKINAQLPKRQNAYIQKAQEVLQRNIPKPEKTFKG